MPTNEPHPRSVKGFCLRNGISESKFYVEVKSGRLKARKVGSRTIIPEKDELEWLDNLPIGTMPGRNPDGRKGKTRTSDSTTSGGAL